jgi:hypothetical protein
VLRLSSKLTKATADAYIYKHSEKGQIKFIPCISNKDIFWPILQIPEIFPDVRMYFHICQLRKHSVGRIRILNWPCQQKKMHSTKIYFKWNFCSHSIKRNKREQDVIKEVINFIMMFASLEIDMYITHWSSKLAQ